MADNIGATFVALVESMGACATQADAARIIGMGGKSFRDVTRDKLGTYVSRGGVWDADAARAWANTSRGRAAIARHLGVAVDTLPHIDDDATTERDYGGVR